MFFLHKSVLENKEQLKLLHSVPLPSKYHLYTYGLCVVKRKQKTKKSNNIQKKKTKTHNTEKDIERTYCEIES